MCVLKRTHPRRIHNDSCAICIEDFTEGLQVKLLPCSHGFHPQCIDPWLKDRSDLCPICKASVVDALDEPSRKRCFCCGPRIFPNRRNSGLLEVRLFDPVASEPMDSPA